MAARVNALVAEYEFFFDNIDEFIKKAKSAVSAGETKHENSRGTVYVCASAEAKKALFNKVAADINLQVGDIASDIGEGLFAALRSKALAEVVNGCECTYHHEARGDQGGNSTGPSLKLV